MRILCECNHPAHFLLFLHAARNLKQHGHQIAFVVRQKDVLLQIIKPWEKEFTFHCRSIKEKPPGMLANINWLIESDWKMLRFARAYKPDIMLGSNFSFAHVGRLLHIPSLLWGEDDARIVKHMARIAFPFCTAIFTPRSCNMDGWMYKTIQYIGYHELAFLHPNQFTPNQAIAAKYVDMSKPYFLVRLAKLTAHHDSGRTGISREVLCNIISELRQTGNVYITSERPLQPEFEPYRLVLNPTEIHHVMAFATLYIGDSQSMTMECAVLGVPSIRFNDFVGEIGYLEEAEHRWHLTFGIRTSHPELILLKAREILETPDFRTVWAERRNAMLRESIDVAAYMTWLIEAYPESLNVLRKDPLYDRRFITL